MSAAGGQHGGIPRGPADPGTRIRYMGNKRALASDVAAVCATLDPERPLVDLFGGMCNVAGAVASSERPVYVNDIQSYAELAARCLIASPKRTPHRGTVETALRQGFLCNRGALRKRFAEDLSEEAGALASASPDQLTAAENEWRHAANDAEVAAELAGLRKSPEFPYRLCALSFSWGYFGLEQAIDLDSLRFAIDEAMEEDRLSVADARWMRFALLQTASRIASSPGHFAQYLRPTNPTATARILSYRSREVWAWFLEDVSTLRPYGTVQWRRRNRVRRGEAVGFAGAAYDLLDGAPAIFYADPPYSKEHYSRFYHVLETLERYDYPKLSGAGRYRDDRFRSGFAVASLVEDSSRALFARVASAEGVLLFSYPSTGLLSKRSASVAGLLSDYFADVSLVVDRSARHSTLGSRHGIPSQSVREQLWLAR